MGPRPERPLRRGARPLEARAAARHARRAHVVPSRDRRALSRAVGSCARVIPRGARDQPVRSRCAGRPSRGGGRDEASPPHGRRGSRPGGAGERCRAPARELHREPLRRARSLRLVRLRPLRPRPGRDPDVPGRRPRPRARLRGAGRARARARGGRAARGARPGHLPREREARRGRPPDAPLRGRLPGGPRGPGARLPRPHVPGPDRLARARRPGRPGRTHRGCDGPGREPERRAARIPQGPAQLAARRAGRARLLRAGHTARGGARARRDGLPRPSARRVRVARRPGRSHRRCHPRLARGRDVLGRGARTHARAREGDRRRLPRRLPRQAAPRDRARPDRDRVTHDRRLRARPRHAPALAVRRAGAAVPVADARLRTPRRRRRHLRVPGAPTPPATRTPTTTTTTTSTRREAFSASASRPGSCPARPRWSSS